MLLTKIGEIEDLIGYSRMSSYEVPADANLKLDTSSPATLESSVETIVNLSRTIPTRKTFIFVRQNSYQFDRK